jgi:hypothetical protein
MRPVVSSNLCDQSKQGNYRDCVGYTDAQRAMSARGSQKHVPCPPARSILMLWPLNLPDHSSDSGYGVAASLSRMGTLDCTYTDCHEYDEKHEAERSPSWALLPQCLPFHKALRAFFTALFLPPGKSLPFEIGPRNSGPRRRNGRATPPDGCGWCHRAL